MRIHLAQRFFNPEYYTGVTVTDVDMTVLLWNLSGQCVGYQKYNPSFPKKSKIPEEAKYFTHVTTGKDAVWGLETLFWTSDFVCVTEGIFDAARLHSHGIPAIAVLGNNPKNLAGWLQSLSHTTIAAVQGDSAGLMSALSTSKAVFLPKDKDVGELTGNEFSELFGKFMEPRLIVW